VQTDCVNDSGVYLIRCLANGRIYVGSSARLALRWSEHRKTLRNGTHRNSLLRNAWRKYGEDAFSFEVLDYAPAAALVALEQRYIDRLRACDRSIGMNLAPTAGTTLGVKHSDETRAKVRASHKGMSGRKHSAETLRKMSEAAARRARTPEARAAMSRWSKGRTLSAETRAKLSAGRKGRALSAEHRARIGEGLKGRQSNWIGRMHSAETRAKMSASRLGNTNRLGDKASDETRARMAAAHIGRTHGPETIAKMSAARTRYWEAARAQRIS
jgi:group I intron endonuclease